MAASRQGWSLGATDVGGELLENEPIERSILVEGTDHVVAVGVGIRPDPVVAEHEDAVLGVGVAGDVEPVPVPSVRRSGARRASGRPRGQKRRRSRSRLEGLDLLGRGRKSDQVVVSSSEQRAAISGWRRRKTFGFQPGQDERINRRPRPAPILHGGGSCCWIG